MLRRFFLFTTILSICLFYLPDLLSSLKSSLNQSSSTHLTSPPSPHSLSQQPANMSRASTSRTLAKAVKATEQSEGVGATVRRSIGTPALRNLSPFLMLDHFKVGKGAGFSEHPHRGQATMYVFFPFTSWPRWNNVLTMMAHS